MATRANGGRAIPQWLRAVYTHLREGSDKPAWIRYLSATTWVAIAFAARLALGSAIGERVPFSFFVTSALIAAWCGGAGPGFYALALGMFVGDWFFLPPVRTLGHYGSVEWALFLTNLVPGVIGVILFETLHRHRRQMREDQRVLAQQMDRCAALEQQVEAARAQVVEYATVLESAVQQRTSELNEAVRCMETFCYSIAHDLRAPIRAMIGFTNAMTEDCEPGSAAQAHAARVLGAARRMDTLVTDLLEYGRVTHVPARFSEVNVEEVAAEAVVLLRTEIVAAGADVVINEGMPTIWGDREMLAHAFVHLIGNALRFAREGVPLRVLISAELSASSVRLKVSDNGCGIPKQYHDKIFGVFATLEPRATPHTGIGLAIVAKIVERMHGQIAVASEPGQGAAFLIDLPAHSRPRSEIRRPDQAMTVSMTQPSLS